MLIYVEMYVFTANRLCLNELPTIIIKLTGKKENKNVFDVNVQRAFL